MDRKPHKWLRTEDKRFLLSMVDCYLPWRVCYAPPRHLKTVSRINRFLSTQLRLSAEQHCRTALVHDLCVLFCCVEPASVSPF